MTRWKHVSSSITALSVLLGAWTASAGAGIEIRALSGRAGVVTGGDVLVEISAAPGIFSATLNGQDITKSFHRRIASGTLVARVGGLKTGKNSLEIKSTTGSAKLELTNYQITGPVFSGPHQRPFVCQTESSGLGAPLDAECSAKTAVTYLYKSTQTPRVFKPFNLSDPRPADVAKTTTSEGKAVDFIVRRERGTINRAIYDIAILDDPARPANPWDPRGSWNGRLVYSFGGGCSAGYRQGDVGDEAINHQKLGAGYAVAMSSLNVFGNTCDDVISAETLMMVKEHFIEQFGVPVHTIGEGRSGGAMQQYLIAQDYPGLLDGIIPGMSFPDIVTLMSTVVDCSLLAHAFDSATAAWTDEQKTAVSGFATWGTCAADRRVEGNRLISQSWIGVGFSPGLVAAQSCNSLLPKASVYDPTRNPGGVRCDLYSNQVNVFGRDTKTGFARRTLDNVGVQYGLRAFNDGKITFEQFLELNQKIGGFDQDGNIVADRSKADPVAVRAAYGTGRVNSGGGSLGSIPIIDFREYRDPTGDIHDSFRSFATRARLMASNGRADNQVIVRAAPGGTLPMDFIGIMDAWLDNLARDPSNDSAAVKVARNKPPEAADTCWTQSGERIVEPASFTGRGRCNDMYPPHANSRIAAGGPLADDILKCTRKPVDPKDYLQALTPVQIARLKAVFPQGVCDYSHPGVGQQPFNGVWHRF